MDHSSRRLTASRGGILIYAIVAMVCMIAFISLAVDLGRARLVKGELQAAADAAARDAASNLQNGITTTQNRAIATAGLNKADGTSVVINSTNDIEFGTWDPTAEVFTVLTGTTRTSATGVRVTARRTTARGNATALTFAKILGRNSVDITAVAIATRGRVVPATVDADACLWLAGMPNGTHVTATDGNPQDAIAPAQSPNQITGLALVAGDKLSFREVSGQTSYVDAANYGPDGNTGWIVQQAATNGINSTKAPLNSLVGIFLDARTPSSYAQAAQLDFSTDVSRDFSTLSPSLKQVFFIGDGIDSLGALQQFTVPTGATRLYLGLMDEKGWWWDNTGQLGSTMLDDNITLVK